MRRRILTKWYWLDVGNTIRVEPVFKGSWLVRNCNNCSRKKVVPDGLYRRHWLVMMDKSRLEENRGDMAVIVGQ